MRILCRCKITQFAKLSIHNLLERLICDLSIDIHVIKAGNKVILKTKAINTPSATMLPKSWKGGESLKLRHKTPIMVVKLVIKIGFKLIRIDSCKASLRFIPLRIL